jgi:hypothetical protein
MLHRLWKQVKKSRDTVPCFKVNIAVVKDSFLTSTLTMMLFSIIPQWEQAQSRGTVPSYKVHIAAVQELFITNSTIQ